MSTEKNPRQCADSASRTQARQALTRGKRTEAAVVAKLKAWECEDQGELFGRQDLRADQAK